MQEGEGQQAPGLAQGHTGQIAEHEEKLRKYMTDPMSMDEKGLLKNAPCDEVRKRIIEGRIKHLKKEIATFRSNIAKLLGQP